MRIFSRPAIFRRLPFGATPSWPPFPPEAEAEFPALAGRFADLATHLKPAFTEHDEAAARYQKSHRRLRLVLILGAMVTGVFGAVQAAYETASWPGITLAIVGAATVAISGYERQTAPLNKALRERTKAEELRSLYFGYLGGLHLAHAAALEKAVAEIRYGQEAG